MGSGKSNTQIRSHIKMKNEQQIITDNIEFYFEGNKGPMKFFVLKYCKNAEIGVAISKKPFEWHKEREGDLEMGDKFFN